MNTDKFQCTFIINEVEKSKKSTVDAFLIMAEELLSIEGCENYIINTSFDQIANTLTVKISFSNAEDAAWFKLRMSHLNFA